MSLTNSLTPYLTIIQHGDTLAREQAAVALRIIMSGDCEPVQVGAFLMGLATRGETVAEVTGMLQVVREQMTTIALDNAVLDTCGTGGDLPAGKAGHAGTFNISTTAALVCAALGVPVAKHGNKAVSSKSGSADVLAELGVPINLTGTAAKQYFQEHNFIFLLAPQYHPAFKQVAPIRQALGIRTIFNVLGPLANPAQVKHQLIGVSDPAKAPLLGEALRLLGSEHVVIVHSADGLDEVSVAAPTSVWDVTAAGTRRWQIISEHPFPLEQIAGGTPAQNAQLIRRLAAGEASAAIIQAVAMNTGLALYAANHVPDYDTGYHQAEQYLRSHQFSNYLNHL